MIYLTASTYLDKARVILGDKVVGTDTVRWSDEDLLAFLNEGIENIASRKDLMKETREATIVSLTPDYDYTDFAYEITRVEYPGQGSLPFISRYELDRLKGKTWMADKGIPTHVVFDKSDVGKLRFYPIPELDLALIPEALQLDSSTFGAVDEVTTGLDTQPLSALLAEVPPEVLLNTPGDYGIPSTSSVVLGSPPAPVLVTLFYVAKKPSYLLTEDVEVDSRLTRPLLDYIVSEALALGIDSENRDLSGKYAKKFYARIEELALSAVNSGGDGMLSSPYNNGFNLDEEPRGIAL